MLEADRVAAGVTGHTTAKVTALHTLIYDRLRRTRGPEGARLYARSQREAIGHAAGTSTSWASTATWESAAAYTYAAATPTTRRDLRAEAGGRARGGAGAPRP